MTDQILSRRQQQRVTKAASSCNLVKTLALAILPIFIMHGDLPQMTLTDDSQSVTLGAIELKRLGMHIC